MSAAPQLTPLERIGQIIKKIFDQLAGLFDLATQENTVETRLKRLRQIYYDDPRVTIKYRRVKELLKGYVDPQYQPYYERLLDAERATYQISKSLHSGARTDELLEQMQTLGEKIARLLDQLQQADHIAGFYKAESQEAQMVAESKEWLLKRIEEALEIHMSIPARVMAFSTVTAGRGVDKLRERIARLTNRLEDIAESYADLDQHHPDYESDLREFLQEDDVLHTDSP